MGSFRNHEKYGENENGDWRCKVCGMTYTTKAKVVDHIKDKKCKGIEEEVDEEEYIEDRRIKTVS